MEKKQGKKVKSQFYVPVEEEDDDAETDAAPTAASSSASAQVSAQTNPASEKPVIRQKPAITKPKPTLTFGSASTARQGLSSGLSAERKQEEADSDATSYEVIMRHRRRTFPTAGAQQEAEETSEASDEDDEDDTLGSFERLSFDDMEDPDRILKKRKLMLKSLHTYFKKMVENMFPKPSEVKQQEDPEEKTKTQRRKGRLFFKKEKARKRKAVSAPVATNQADFLAHLANELGDDYRPDEIPGILQSLGDIRFSELLKLEEESVQLRPERSDVVRTSSVFLTVPDEEQKAMLAPRVESVIDSSGKMTRRLPIPAQPHKLMLLKELFSKHASCSIVIDEVEGVVVFEGTEESVQEAHDLFDAQMNKLVEDRRDFTKTLTSIFRSPLGQVYLSDVTSAHNCKLHIGTTFVLCAGFARNDVRGCLMEIESDVRREPIQLNNLTNQDLERLRRQIEGEYLARMIYQDAADGEVLLEGLGRDVDLTKGFLLRQAEEHLKDTDIFLIKGEARAKCFKHCFMEQLNRVKDIIRENKGSFDERFENDRFMLTYQVRQGLMDEVQVRLKVIRGSIWENSADLKEEFPDIIDQWLLLEGFRKTDVKNFQASFERNVREQCFLEISITSKRWGTVVRSETTETKKGRETPVPKRLNPIMNWFFTGRLKAPPFYRSIIIRNTLVTVMSGDISAVTADVLVSPIGKDLKMSQTSVGTAFLKRFGQHVQQTLSRLESHHRDVIETSLPPDQLPVCAIYHAVLHRWTAPADAENIKTLVKTCLALAEENRCGSIAFPLLGCGKKFKLNFDTVTTAMVDATRATLSKTRAGASLQKITFVLYSVREAQSFAQKLEVLAPAAAEQTPVTSDLEESGDWLLEKLASAIPKAEQTDGVLLMGHLYGPSRDIVTTMRARLVQELRECFLYEDSVEHAGLLQLPKHATIEIRTAASLDSVIITRPPTGGSCVRLKGEHQAVSKLKELIQGKLLECLQLPTYTPASNPSPQIERHLSSYHFPAYWSTAANRTLLEETVQKRFKLVAVSEEERTAIENLVRGTWDPNLVTAGWDAAGLRHRSIDIIKVERLENPSLYESYHSRRSILQRECSGDNGRCVSVGSVPFASGHVQTTSLLTSVTENVKEWERTD